MTGSSSLSAHVTWRGFQIGAARMIVPGFASMPFGIGFGVAAAQKGISAFEVTLMSFTVLAGTAASPADSAGGLYGAFRDRRAGDVRKS